MVCRLCQSSIILARIVATRTLRNASGRIIIALDGLPADTGPYILRGDQSYDLPAAYSIESSHPFVAEAIAAGADRFRPHDATCSPPSKDVPAAAV